MVAPTTILVAVDFSDCSISAYRAASSLAARFGATLHLLHVVTEPLQETWVHFAPGAELVDMLKACEAKARERLDALSAAGEIARERVVVSTVWGNPSDEILKYASEKQVDLIVCGTHGRRGWDRMMIGSVAERVIRLAPCPVLTVPTGPPTAAAVA